MGEIRKALNQLKTNSEPKEPNGWEPPSQVCVCVCVWVPLLRLGPQNMVAVLLLSLQNPKKKGDQAPNTRHPPSGTPGAWIPRAFLSKPNRPFKGSQRAAHVAMPVILGEASFDRWEATGA